MRIRPIATALVILASCASSPPPTTPPGVQVVEAAPALLALRNADFPGARRGATQALAADPHNAQAAAARALATYVDAGDRLMLELRQVIESADAIHAFDHEAGRAIWTRFLGELDAVDRDLAVAAADPQFSLELCLARWPEHDWNHNGRIDDGDRHLFEIETDGSGHDLAEGDPRRKPTFRFDAGDIQWARAMIAFQKAGAELVLAYRWSELDKLFGKREERDRARIVIHLIDADRVRQARADILAGLDYSAKERAAYLAETDDDHEWVPNPHQHSAVPLPVDSALYARWADLLGNAQHLLASDDGIPMRDAARLVDPRAAMLVPDAYIDLGRMLREPTDFTFDLADLDGIPTPDKLQHIARDLLGHGYAEHMRASPLVTHLRDMMSELDRGEDTLGHKLHYLLYLN